MLDIIEFLLFFESLFPQELIEWTHDILSYPINEYGYSVVAKKKRSKKRSKSTS